MNCDYCNNSTPTISALVNGKYISNICRSCLNAMQTDSAPSSGVANWNRQRDYADNAADTVQPWTASGANPEFLRLYPESAKKQFKPDVIEKLKRQL